MKKIFSALLLISMMLTLSSCYREVIVEVPVYPDEDKDTDKDTDKEDDKDTDDEDDKDTDKPSTNYDKLYEPGVYFTSDTNDGVTTFVSVIIDDYGLVSGVHFDNNKSSNKYLYNKNTKDVYLFVEGISGVVSDSYRLIDTASGVLPSINDSITTDDLVVGYTEHDSIIKSLTTLKTNETQQIADLNSKTPSKTWSGQMNLIADKIVSDQTTLGIKTHKSGDSLKVTNISGVDILLTNELELVQDLLDDEAVLKSGTKLKDYTEPEYGNYESGQNFYVDTTNPVVNGSEIYYQYAFVAIDTYGKIAGVYLDETKNGSTRYLSKDEKFIEEANALSDAIVLSQNLEGFKFVDEDLKPVSFDEAKNITTEGGELLNPITISNNKFSSAANKYIHAIDKSLEKQYFALEDGNYFVSDNYGNMMSTTIKNGVIASLTLDTLDSSDSAYTVIDGEEYELYTYNKTYTDFSQEEVEVQVLVYKDGVNYYYTSTDASIDMEEGDKVEFDEEHDEEKSLKKLSGFITKATASHSTDSKELSFYEQSRLYTNYFIGKNTPYGLNMLQDGTTDTIEGLTMKVSQYNDLLAGLLITATDKDNEAKNIYLAEDFVKDKFGEDRSERFLLADGSYYAVSNTVTEEGGFYYLTVTVKDNEIYSIMFDETVEINGKLSTKAREGDNYKVEYDDGSFIHLSSKDVEKDSLSYTEAIFEEIIEEMSSNDFEYVAGSGELLDDYDYEENTSLESDADFISSSSEALYNFNDAFEKIILSGLQSRVKETITDVKEYIVENLSDNYVVASEDSSEGAYSLDLFVESPDNNLLFIGGSQYLTVNAESDDNDLDVDSEDDISLAEYEDGTSLIFTVDEEDLMTSKYVDIEFELSFDDYSSDFVQKIPVYSMAAYYQRLLDTYTEHIDGTVTYVNDEYTINDTKGFYEGLVSNSVISLELPGYTGTDPLVTVSEVQDRLGEDIKITTDLMFEVESIDDAYAFVDFVVLKDGSSELVLERTKIKNNEDDFTIEYDVTADEGTYEYGNYEIEIDSVFHSASVDMSDGSSGLQAIDFDGVTISATKGKVSVEGSSSSSKDNESIAEVFAGILELKEGDSVAAELDEQSQDFATVTVVTDKDEKGSITLKAYYDNFDQKDAEDGKGTHQSTEASRQITFDVYGETEALKYIRDLVELKTAFETVTSIKYDIDLVDVTDHAVAGLDIEWSGIVDASANFDDYKIAKATKATIDGIELYLFKTNKGFLYEYQGKLYNTNSTERLGSIVKTMPTSGYTFEGAETFKGSDEVQDVLNYIGFGIVSGPNNDEVLAVTRLLDASTSVSLEVKVANTITDKEIGGYEYSFRSYLYDEDDTQPLLEQAQLSIEDYIDSVNLNSLIKTSDLKDYAVDARDLESEISDIENISDVQVSILVDGKTISDTMTIEDALLTAGADSLTSHERFNVKFEVEFEFEKDKENYSYVIEKSFIIYNA